MFAEAEQLYSKRKAKETEDEDVPDLVSDNLDFRHIMTNRDELSNVTRLTERIDEAEITEFASSVRENQARKIVCQSSQLGWAKQSA